MHICFQMPIASIHYKQACHHLGSDCCMRLCADKNMCCCQQASGAAHPCSAALQTHVSVPAHTAAPNSDRNHLLPWPGVHLRFHDIVMNYEAP